MVSKDGNETLSKTVVLAIGNNTIVNIPSYLTDKVVPSKNLQDVGVEGEGWCHTSSFARPGYVFPNMELKSNPNSRLLVVGGG